MNSLRDRVYPVTRSSNASECDVTFERYYTLEHMHACYSYSYSPKLHSSYLIQASIVNSGS